MYAGTHDDRLVTLREIADAYKISLNHLRKVVHQLAGLGYLHTTRGRGGGMQLGWPAEEISLGEVVAALESSMEIVDCERQPCPLRGVCALKDALNDARDAFVERLDEYTLADLLADQRTSAQIVHLVSQPRNLARARKQ
jgi:Rrf2 family nitric oxide-sensitive transcriptional repressor